MTNFCQGVMLMFSAAAFRWFHCIDNNYNEYHNYKDDDNLCIPFIAVVSIANVNDNSSIILETVTCSNYREYHNYNDDDNSCISIITVVSIDNFNDNSKLYISLVTIIVQVFASRKGARLDYRLHSLK